MQTNEIEQAVQLFAEVLQVKARHFGGAAAVACLASTDRPLETGFSSSEALLE
jgi:hypothetical protein